MANCPTCNKFASLEMQDPEVNDLSVADHRKDEDNNTSILDIDYEVRIVRNSECCGDEMKEYTFCDSLTVEVEGHTGEDCEISIDEDSAMPVEESGSRYAKSYYGFSMQGTLTCSCGEDVNITNVEGNGTLDEGVLIIEDKVAASEMEEC